MTYTLMHNVASLAIIAVLSVYVGLRVNVAADSIRRLIIGLLTTTGAVLFTAVSLVGVAINLGNEVFSEELMVSIVRLAFCGWLLITTLFIIEQAISRDKADTSLFFATAKILGIACFLMLSWGSVTLIFAVGMGLEQTPNLRVDLYSEQKSWRSLVTPDGEEVSPKNVRHFYKGSGRFVN